MNPSAPNRRPAMAPLLALTLGAAACAGLPTTPADAPAPVRPRPGWVDSPGSGPDAERAYAVGSAAGTPNLILLRAQAVERAMARLALQSGVKIQAMLSDYSAVSASHRESHITDVSKLSVSEGMDRLRLERTWVDRAGRLYALVSVPRGERPPSPTPTLAQDPVRNPGADAADSPLAQEFQGAPGWVLGNCQELFAGVKVVCGVGSSAAVDPDLASLSAAARAMTALARAIEVHVQSTLKDHSMSEAGGEASTGDTVEDVSKQVTSQTLVGAAVAATWVSPSNTTYAVAAMDLQAWSERNQAK